MANPNSIPSLKTALYVRVSTHSQHPENQLLALRKYAEARGLEVLTEYVDAGQSGGKASRPELDRLMMDARRRKFNVVLVSPYWLLEQPARADHHNLTGGCNG